MLRTVRLLSIRIVTGPSLTSSTCIIAWNSPVAPSAPPRAILARHPRRARAPSSGGAASSNDGRRPLPHIAGQRELRHDEHAAADVDDGSIHRLAPASPRPRRSARRGSSRDVVARPRRAVALLDADEHEQAAADLAHDAIADASRAPRSRAERPLASSHAWRRMPAAISRRNRAARPAARRLSSFERERRRCLRSSRAGIQAAVEQMARHDVAERFQHRLLDAGMLALEIHDQPLDALALQAEIAAGRTAAADDRQLAFLRVRRAPRLR